MKEKYFWAGVLFLIIAIIALVFLFGCQSAVTRVETGGGDIGELEGGDQNNPWPWFLTVVINNAIWVIMIFSYIYCSKRFPIIGRK